MDCDEKCDCSICPKQKDCACTCKYEFELNNMNDNENEATMEDLRKKLKCLRFAIIELGLYLDTHPNDKDALSLYRNYLNIEKQSCREYEKKYGPLTCDSEYIGNNSWAWDNSPWPWEVK